ncbi:YhaN family protein [Bradyrhizobium cenepequi]|uniref:YhaN family protein n=1 Tax=Bradyrhizobium cenepequi TaxID=2821403 RepID=UPI001CE35F12|nr:YhaN family protein [Bradyrhizobium cenepequi]MCA6111593.1 AAA family ATPase [Bradyrhizobium cenepequi]
MRIEHLVLERYGVFSDRKLSFHPEAALHVVRGANEAGKTSALSAISDLLFGFSARTDYDFRHDSKTLRIGGCLRHSDGRTVTARRRKGNKNTLVDEHDQPLPDDRLSFILEGLSRESFNREFGLTAQALRDGGYELLKAGGRLAETLAASSAGMAALSRVKERLEGEADDLFTPRRSANKPFYVAAERRDNSDRALRDAIVTRDAIRQAESAVQEAKARLDALSTEHDQAGALLVRWRRTLRVRPHLLRLDNIGMELAVLSALPLVSEQSLSEWRAALNEHGAISNEIAALKAAGAADEAEIATMAVDEALLSQGAKIDGLREALGAVRKATEDLPRRRLARDQAQGILEEAARRLGLPSHVELLERLPTDPALALARDLIEQTRRAEKAIADANLRGARARQEYDDLAIEDAKSDLVDIEHLRQRFDALGDVPAQSERLRRDVATLNAEMRELTCAVASLDPPPGELEQLHGLALPDAAAIVKYAHRSQLNESEAKRLRDAIAATDDIISATKAELTRLSSAGAVPTRADLSHARSERDVSLDGLRLVLEGDSDQRALRFEEIVRSSRDIDSVTDLLLADTGRATRQEDGLERLAASRNARDSYADRLTKLQADLAAEEVDWRHAWAASGLVPRGPADMLRWRERLDDVLSKLRKCDSQKFEVDALASSLELGKAAVIAFLECAGRTADPTLAPEILFREAKARFDELQAARADTKARSVAKKRAERDMAEAKAEVEAAEAELAEVRRRLWPAAMSGIGLSEAATPAEAEAALAVWQFVAVPKASYEREGRSVDTIGDDLQAFDRDVFGVLDRVAPQLKSASAQESLARIMEKLGQARRDSETCRRLRENAAKRTGTHQALLARREAIAAVLGDARSKLGVADMGDLSAPLERIAIRHRLEADQANTRRELYVIADGRDEDTLRRERENLDLDVLPGEIERETVRQKQLLKDIADASAIHHQAKFDLEVLTKGRNAAAAAAERAEANAELLSIAERWILKATASRLAARTIERYRAMVQDPLIARAGSLFALATDHAFAGLGIDYSEDDQPVLIAERHDAERVPVSGLSEGTRDQLFLALRLALLERWPTEPMPFIGDDLLASFDERRTLATLRLLAAAGHRRQIIVFTHHQHVVDLAKSIQDKVIDLVEL